MFRDEVPCSWGRDRGWSWGRDCWSVDAADTCGAYAMVAGSPSLWGRRGVCYFVLPHGTESEELRVSKVARPLAKLSVCCTVPTDRKVGALKRGIVLWDRRGILCVLRAFFVERLAAYHSRAIHLFIYGVMYALQTKAPPTIWHSFVFPTTYLMTYRLVLTIISPICTLRTLVATTYLMPTAVPLLVFWEENTHYGTSISIMHSTGPSTHMRDRTKHLFWVLFLPDPTRPGRFSCVCSYQHLAETVQGETRPTRT